MTSLLRSPRLLASLLLPLSAAVASAAPRDDLIRLVPDDVGFCLVIGDLRAHHEKLLRSPWIKAVAESPFGKALRNAPEFAQLRQVEAQLRKRLNVTWAQLRDEILGDAVVLAYRPGPPGKPEEETGLLMLWARDRALLARLVEALNREQKKAGELKSVEERVHKGLKYHRRIEAEGETFYYLDGPVLAFAPQEEILRQVLDRVADPKAAKTLPMSARLKEVGTDRGLATLWVNPRTFDAELARQAAKLDGPQAHALKTFLVYWKALDGASLSLTVERDPEVVLALHARAAALPPAARRLVDEAATPSDLWGRFPKDGIFTAAARVDMPALFEALGEFLTPEARKAVADGLKRALGLPLSEALTKQVLPSLGPDAGLCVLPPADRTGPPQLLVALRVRPGPKGERMDKAILGTLQFLAGLAVLDHNLKKKDKLHLKKETQDGVEVHYFVGGSKFPPGVRPAFALKDGYLVLASSPAAVRRFAAVPAPLPPSKEVPLLRLSAPQLAKLLRERADLLADLLGARAGVPPEQAAAGLKGLVAGLELFDGVELTQRRDGDRVAWIVRLRTAAPKQ
jgi:hypothetical protein